MLLIIDGKSEIERAKVTTNKQKKHMLKFFY